MKTRIQSICLVSLFILSITKLHAQTPEIEWIKNLGGSSWDSPHAIHPTSDGGFFIFAGTHSQDGDIASSNHGNYDLWGIKVDSEGNLIWEKCYGGSGYESLRDGIVSSDGSYVFTGWSNSSDGDVGGNNGNYDFWIFKVDTLGNLLWETNLGGSLDDKSHQITETNDGGFIATGYTASSDGDVSNHNGEFDVWVVKLSSDGLLEWEKTYGGSLVENGEQILQTKDGGYILIAYTTSTDGDVTSTNGSRDYWILKLNNLGDIEWENCYGGSDNDRPLGITITPDNGYAICGQSSSSDGDVSGHYGLAMYHDLWVMKIDSVGAILWESIYGGTKYDIGMNIINTSDGGFAIVGHTLSIDNDVTGNNGAYDSWVVKIDAGGNLQWQKCVGSSASDKSYSILQTSPTSYVYVGTSAANDGDIIGNQGESDVMIVKLNTALNIDDVQTESNIYPNPASDHLHLNLGNQNTPTRVNIINCQAVVLKSIILEPSENTIDISVLSKGLYFVEIDNGKETFIKKIIKE